MTLHSRSRSRTIRAGVAAALGTTLLAGCSLSDVLDAVLGSAGTSTVTYEASDEVIANPGRGFYHAPDTHYRADGSGYEPLDEKVLAGYRSEGITMVYRGFYLERFVGGEALSKEYLALVQADFDAARAAGVSLVPRFAYVEGGDFPYEPPYGDADLDVVLKHVRQLGPVLRKNSDVIATVQAGLIGLWGEWYYTDDFAADPADPGVLTDEDREKRRQVVAALLEELPEDRTIQVRTPAIKQYLLDVPTGAEGALTQDEAYSGSPISRMGHHNDCLLASEDDFGTFLSDPLTLDQSYLQQDSSFVPVGGETCAVNPPRSEYPSAKAELERYHYSFLNADYNQDVLSSWGADGTSEVARRLGYRFVMEESRATSTDHGARVAVEVRNDGWSAPYNPRPARFVLTGEQGTFAVPTDVDARTWGPGTTSTLAADVCGLPDGHYDVALDLPSPDASVAGDPDYSIQTANTGTWQAERGRNDLRQSVLVGASTTACATPAEQIDD